MRVVINSIPLLSPLTGVGKYTYNMVNGLIEQRPDHNYTYFYGYFTKELSYYNSAFYKFKEFVKKIPIASYGIRLLRERKPLIQLNNYDLYFEPNFIPCNIKANKTVVTVHDFSFHHNPEWHPKDRIQYFSKHFFNRIGKADVIITMSDFIAQEAKDIIKPQNSEVISIPEGYDGNVFNSNGDSGGCARRERPFILYVGSIEPRKNLLNLLKAYLLLPENIRKEFKLLLVGFKGWHNAEVMALIEKAKENVEYLGYVSDAELADLYRGASCFVYPSFYEGFGLPPLEAMACGCPVVVSNKASLPEVCGDASVYIDPHNPESIADEMHKVLTDTELRNRLSARGIERAKSFSWHRTVEEHIKVFERVAG